MSDYVQDGPEAPTEGEVWFHVERSEAMFESARNPTTGEFVEVVTLDLSGFGDDARGDELSAARITLDRGQAQHLRDEISAQLPRPPRRMNDRERVENALAAMSDEDKATALKRLAGDIYVSSTATALQGRRLEEQAQTGPEWIADQRMFVESVWDTYRASRRCKDLLTDPADIAFLNDALDRFTKALPEIQQVRDKFQHSDAYLLGAGRAQNPGETLNHFYERQGTDVTIYVDTVRIKVADAATETAQLASDVIVGLTMRPYGRALRAALGLPAAR